MAPDFTDSDREPDETDGSNETPGASQDGPSGPVDGALDVIDRSIGMYVLRRLTGRSSTAASEADAPAVLTADQIAKRIGVAGLRRPHGPSRPRLRRRSLPGQRRTAAARATAAPRVPPRSQGSAAEVGPELDRLTRGRDRPRRPPARLLHRASDSSATRASRSSPLPSSGLAVVMWPQGGQTGEPTGERFVVDRAVVTPEPSDERGDAHATAATGEVAVETDVPVRRRRRPPLRRTRPSHRRS